MTTRAASDRFVEPSDPPPASGAVAPASGPARRWWRVGAVVALVGIVVALYWPTLHYAFVYDDFHLVVANPHVRAPASQWWSFFVPGHGAYRPLRTLSYAIDYRLGGFTPSAFRRTNILLHAGATLVVFALALELGIGWAGAAAAAALFAVHPVQTESVTYISGRRDVLCGLFFFASVAAYVRFRLTRRTRWVAAAIGAAAAAVLAKEMAATIPLVCAAYEWCGAGRTRTAPEIDRPMAAPGVRAIVIAALVATAAVLILAFYGHVIFEEARRLPWHGGSIEANFATVSRIWVHYWKLLVYPRTLVADYSGKYFPLSGSFLEPAAAASTLGIVVWIAVAVALRRRAAVASLAMLWLPITLLPVSHLVPHSELIAEHYLYIPAFGMCLLAGVVVAAAVRRSRLTALVATVAVVIAVGALARRTALRNRDWSDSLTFYTVLREQNRYSPRVYLGLGNEYVQIRQPRLAVAQFSQGLRFAPDSPWLYVNRAAAYQQIGEIGKAENDYRKAIALGLDTRVLWSNLGLLYASTHRYREARHALARARRLTFGRPDPAILTNMALLLEAEGNLDRAVRVLRRASRLDPHNGAIRTELARMEGLRVTKTP